MAHSDNKIGTAPERFDRVLMSREVRLMLCAIAAADINRPLPDVDVDWQELFEAVCHNGLLALAQRYIRHQPAAQTQLPQTFRDQVRSAASLEALQTALQYEKVGWIVEKLNQANLAYLVVKGPAVAATIFQERALRSFHDLDLIVRERDWSTTHQLLLELGFIQMDKIEKQVIRIDRPKPPPKIIPQAVIYELKYWQPAMQFPVEVHFDDVLNCGLAARDVEGFWRRSLTIEVEGLPIQVMALEDQLLHLCMHLHFHGYTRLSAFSDIALVVRDHADRLNWELFLQIVRTEEAETGVYYSLYYVQEMLQVGMPAQVMAELRPSYFVCSWHDWLLPPKSVMSLEPMWRPDFSFYFLPLYKRLLPDLLVMGRRKEKMWYLLRLIAPPRDWLQDYYDLDTEWQVTLHYLLHPLKLCAHYLIETLQLLFPRRQS